jgi:DNA processing protein
MRWEGALDNREAYLVLSLLPGIGPVRVNQLLTLFGEPRAILAAKPAELARVPGIGGALAEVLSNWSRHCDLAQELRALEQAGVRFVCRDDEDYPPLLRQIHDPPLGLYVRGNASLFRGLQAAIAVVGSRHTTHYGVAVAENLAAAAAVAGWTVVSGLAQGIDAAAHLATLDAHGVTVAVLGSGLGHIYPQENVPLARRIAAEGGAVVSEFPMPFRPDKRTFPMRNRIISGMCRGCLVVEAGDRSGSLITANQALDQNRQVFAVPGRIDSAQSRGCHRLIKEGAKLVETFQDVLEEFVTLPGLQAACQLAEPVRESGPRQTEIRVTDLQLSDLERKIISFLGDQEAAIDAVVAGAGEPPAKVLGALVALEMRRLVRQLPGKRVVRHGAAITG